jgi:HD-like signal output (HDOD) protein
MSEEGAKSQTERKVLTPEEFLEKLKSALSKNGDFPASAKIVTELRMLTSDPATTASKLSEVILREPSLGVRVLHLVNSSYYKRVKPISTITQAVVQVGMKPLAEMCAGLVLLQRFVPEARQNSAFASCLRKSIVTSLLASSLASQQLNTASKTLATRNAESGFLAGTMAEIGVLLMAFYFPQVYESALKRAEQKKQDIAQSIKQIVGFSPAQLSGEVISTLNLPQYYADVASKAQEILESPSAAMAARQNDLGELAKCLGAAMSISDAIASANDSTELVSRIRKIQVLTGLSPEFVMTSLKDLNNGVAEHCASLDLKLPPLPEALETIALDSVTPAKGAKGSSSAEPDKVMLAHNQEVFDNYIDDIEIAINRGEPTANILTSVMEACAYCLGFDRVLLLLANKTRTTLVGRMMLGSVAGVDPAKIQRPLGASAEPDAPDNCAFIEARVVFMGESIFPEGSPVIAIPVGYGKRAVGVVYADRTSKPESILAPQEQAALVLLADLLDRSLQKVAKSS